MKRIINLKVLSLVLLAAFIGSGCLKKIDEFGDININPLEPVNPIPSALLTGVTSGLGNWIFDGNYYRPTSIPGMYAQYISQTQYTEESRYGDLNRDWTVYYAGSSNGFGLPRANLMDLQTIIDYNTNEETKIKAAEFGSNNNQIAVARILKSYLFWMLTDLYGALPYTGTLQGEPNLAYDDQPAIYAALLKEFKEAVAQFDDGPMPSGDVLFNGNKDKWIKFANSLRLQMALRMSVADPATGKAEFNSALDAGVIEDNSNNAVLYYPGGSFTNPYYEYYNIIQRQDISPSQFFVSMLETTGDNRLSVFASTDVGFPYGLTRADALAWSADHPNWANVMSEEYYNNDQSPMYLLTAAHMWLARAEAALLGWTSEDPATAYAKGIEASWKQWGVYDAGALSSYLAEPTIALSGSQDEKYEKIATQRWISFYPDGKQGWAIWRKTGYPVLTPAPGTTQGIPQRYPYGSAEASLNPENYEAASQKYVANGEPNSVYAELWWAQQ